MGDWHADCEGFNEEKLIRMLEWCEKTNTGLMLTGDLHNFGIIDSVSFTYGTSLPTVDYSVAGQILSRYKHLIYGIVSGNHDDRIFKRVGIDPIKLFCEKEDIPYHTNGIIISLKLGKLPNRTQIQPYSYNVFVTHTTGGGRTIGAKINKVHRLQNVVQNADIYLGGHSHDLSGTKVKRITIDMAHQRLISQVKGFANCGSYMEYVGYPAKMNLEPTATGAVRVRLDGTKKDFHLSI